MKSPMVQAFAALDAHRSVIAKMPLRERFAEDPDRFRKFSLSPATCFSTIRRTSSTRRRCASCSASPRTAEVEKHRDAMFARRTDQRDREPPGPARRAALDARGRIAPAAKRRAGGACRARPHGRFRRRRPRRRRSPASAASFTDVVNIGIGGSDLGPAHGDAALCALHDGPRAPFRLQRRRRRHRATR